MPHGSLDGGLTVVSLCSNGQGMECFLLDASSFYDCVPGTIIAYVGLSTANMEAMPASYFLSSWALCSLSSVQSRTPTKSKFCNHV